MPPRPTPARTIALITALGVIPPALVFYVDAKFSEAPEVVDAGAPDGSATKSSTAAAADAGTVDLDENVDPPSWDEPFTDLQAELEKSCGSAAASSSVRDLAEAQERERACVHQKVGAALPAALAALPAERRQGFAALFRALDADVDRLCVLGDERAWSNDAHGLRYDEDERQTQHFLPCLRSSRQGLLFLLRAMAKGEVDTFTTHLDSAAPVGQATRDAIADLKARVDASWDRGLRTGYLRLRVGAGGQGVLGPRAWANLASLSERSDAAATRFGEAVCQAWPALSAARESDCNDSLALYFHALVTVDPPRKTQGDEDAEEDLLGPSLTDRHRHRTSFAYLPGVVRERISWTPAMGEPLEAATLTPVVTLVEGAANEAFDRALAAAPARAAARIREQALWTRHVSKLCWLDEALFWHGPGLRYHGKGEGVVGALCRARAFALRRVELGLGAVSFADALDDMDSDARVVLERFTAAPLPARARLAPRPVDLAHCTPLTPVDERALTEARASLLTSAAALAQATCAAWQKEDRPPLADCEGRLRAYYLAYGAFSSVPVERDD